MTRVKEYPTSWGQRTHNLCYCLAFVVMLWLGWGDGWLRVLCGIGLIFSLVMTKALWKTWTPIEPHWSDYR
jgi:hypothetical protein